MVEIKLGKYSFFLLKKMGSCIIVDIHRGKFRLSLLFVEKIVEKSKECPGNPVNISLKQEVIKHEMCIFSRIEAAYFAFLSLFFWDVFFHISRNRLIIFAFA